MKKRTYGLLRYITLPCLFGCLSLSADDMDNMNDQSNGRDHFMSTYDRLKGTVVTPNAGPVVQHGVDVALEASYILWHASQSGLEFVTSGVPADPVTSGMQIDRGAVYNPKFKMTSGYKAGIGFDFDYDGWDLNLMYTWLYSHADRTVVGPESTATDDTAYQPSVDLGLVPGNFTSAGAGFAEVPPYFFNNVAANSQSSWRLHFNMFDLALGRHFFLSPKLTVRPHFGLKGGWINQKNRVAYTVDGTASGIVANGVTINTDTVISTPTTVTIDSSQEEYAINLRSRYWGAGIRTGFDTSWMFTRCFSLYGNLAFSSLWSQFTLSRRDVSQVVDQSTQTIVLNDYTAYTARERIHRLNPVLEMAIGFCYDYMFSEDEYRFRIRAGWEQQIWWNQLPGADLSLQGLTIDLRVDF